MCRFGREGVSRAEVVSSTVLLCAAPRTKPGVVSLEVSFYSMEYTASGTRFVFRAESQWSIYPTAGPASGGSVVTVTGAQIGGESRTLSLYFGDVMVEAHTVTSGEALVFAPQGPYGPASVVLADEYLLPSSDKVTNSYHYHARATLQAIYPSSAPSSRAAAVTIIGHPAPRNPKPETRKTLNPKQPEMLIPQPQIPQPQIPQPQIPNPIRQTPYAKPHTPNPKPQTPNPKPQTPNNAIP